MIMLPIFLALASWLLFLRLCNQHKYLNVFEQIVVWFVCALSVFLLELFLQGVWLNHLSLLFPILTFCCLLAIFIYKSIKISWYIQEIIVSIKSNFIDIWKQFNSLKLRKKIVICWVLIYAFVKIIMVFSINTNMPTFDDDAVNEWDLKTKVFSTNLNLVLDKTNPEYFGTNYGRYPFAGILDTYFLLPYGWFVNWLSNIISSLMYCFALLLLFGIFLRKTNIFIAALSLYLFSSLPFVFIHGVWAYRNFPAWVFLFMFVFYLIDQLFHLEKDYWWNTKILLPIVLIWFISSVVRNEGVMLTWITFLTIIVSYHILKKGRIKELRYQLFPLIPVILGYIINKIIFSFYPTWSLINTWWTQVNAKLLDSFFVNVSTPGVFIAPFQQMFYHPDYLLLFWLFLVSSLLFFFWYKKFKQYRIFAIVIFSLLAIFLFILYANLGLWLLTHFAFTRYPVSIILFLIYFICSIVYVAHEYKKS